MHLTSDSFVSRAIQVLALFEVGEGKSTYPLRLCKANLAHRAVHKLPDALHFVLLDSPHEYWSHQRFFRHDSMSLEKIDVVCGEAESDQYVHQALTVPVVWGVSGCQPMKM